MKTKEEIKSFVIRNFLERNYKIYTSVTDDSFCIERDHVVGTAIIIKTTRGSKDRLIVDLRDTKTRSRLDLTHYTYIIAVEVEKKNIWMIPVDDIAENRTLNLNERKNHYLLLEKHPDDDVPHITDIALKEAVRETIIKHKKLNDEHKTDEEQIDAISNMLGDHSE